MQSHFLTNVFRSDVDLWLGMARLSQRTLSLWLLMSRGALAMLVALSSASSPAPILFVVVLLLLILLFVTRMQPFVLQADNKRNFVSLSLLIMTYAGAAVLSQPGQSAQVKTISKEQYVVVSWMIIAANAVYVVWAVFSYWKARSSQGETTKIKSNVDLF